MTICSDCGVELEDDMTMCPLCEKPVKGPRQNAIRDESEEEMAVDRRRYFLQQVLWQVTSVLLLSGIVATLIINLSAQGAVTWSIYPMSICMIIFSYASLMALWRKKVVFQVLAGWLISIIVLIMVSWLTAESWPVWLALPILSAANVLGLSLYVVLKNSKAKGLNILAVIFVDIAILCLAVEGIISLYVYDILLLRWSVIVAACLLPVTAAILFMYFRTRRNIELQKIFHT